MRQIGQLDREIDAHRFAAFLVTEGISAHAEEDGDGWIIWVRDENSVESAREEFAEFRRTPDDARYRGAERQAETIQRQETKRREQAQKNVVQMRSKWGRGSSRRRPLTLTVIGICVLIGLMTNMGRNVTKPAMCKLLFVDVLRLSELEWNVATVEDKAADVLRGEVWRLLTPAFVHYGPWHLAFNMIMFYQIGSMIEERRGSLRLGLMILAIAVVSNTVQSLVPYDWDGSPFGAGFSGVVFGLFAYVWIKSIYAPQLGLGINRNTVFILMLWLFLGISGVLSQFGLHVANWTHGIGFLVGAAIAYLPETIKNLGAN